MSNPTVAEVSASLPELATRYMAAFAVLSGDGNQCIAVTHCDDSYSIGELLGDTDDKLNFQPTASNCYDLESIAHGGGAWGLEHAVRELEEPELVARWLRIFHGVKARAVLFTPDKSSWVGGVVFGDADDDLFDDYVRQIRDYLDGEVYQVEHLERIADDSDDDFDEVDLHPLQPTVTGYFGYKSQAELLAGVLTEHGEYGFKLEGARLLSESEYNLYRQP